MLAAAVDSSLLESHFQAGCKHDAALFDHHRANRQQGIARRIQPAGFDIDRNPAHVGKRLFQIDRLLPQRGAPRAAGGIQRRASARLAKGQINSL